MNYHRNMILATFRANRPNVLDPGEDRLEQLDTDLHETLNEQLEKKAGKHGIPINKFNLSMLVFFAEMSKSDDPATKAEAACKYFNSTMPVP